jgi:hypothetical protein
MAIHTGVDGGTWRATITGSGVIEPADGSPPLRWFVAADDRWHVPEHEPTVRQRRVNGTPVVETRLRVPRGDVVQTIYSSRDMGGVTIVDVTNESTLPVAIAFDRRDLLTQRAIADVPIEGIELPAGSFVMPLGHRANLRVGLAHDRPRSGALPRGLPDSSQVVRGWLGRAGRASRFVFPDGELWPTLAERVVTVRCEIVLGRLPNADDEPVEFVLALHELTRMGERVEPWLMDLASALERLAGEQAWGSDVALRAGARMLLLAGERRAVADVERVIGRRTPATPAIEAPDGVAGVAWLESCLAESGALFPRGIPPELLGQSFEMHGVPTGVASSVSLAVRWHGARPAVLWEQAGPAVTLSAPVAAPGWSSTERAGEALWPAP